MEQKELAKLALEYIDKGIAIPPSIKTVYHYTTVDALVNGILPEKYKVGKEVCLRATHYKYVNDPTELMDGYNIMVNTLLKDCPIEKRNEFKKELLKVWKDTYMISFSCAKNSLPMWNAYGNRGYGIAIELKRPKTIEARSIVLRCLYTSADVSKYLKRECKLPADLLTAYLPLMIKHKAYKYEKEIRFVGDFEGVTTQYREKNGFIIPYKSIYFPKEQIKSITIGPCLNPNETYYSLREFLNNRGLEKVPIIPSFIPFRNL